MIATRYLVILCILLPAAGNAPGTAFAAESTPGLVFACRADNDLYRVLTAGGTECIRHDKPIDAVRAAPKGAGVLILADGYPKETTAIDPAVFEEAAKKRLRLYVEYPSSLPGVEVGQPRSTQWERTVVASDAFGESLAKMRILAIHDCRFVHVAADRPHLVLARVAGFDTAGFGLPKTVYPVLFEHPRGDVLVATTKLSQFVTARYGPTDAWPAVWRMVLGWLQPGKTVPRLEWTAVVRPSFARDQELPKDAEREAVRRGIDWFFNAGMLIQQPGQGQLPGDGSLGVKEGFASRIHCDGTQAVNAGRRFDCNGETSGAMALAGAALGEPKYREVAGRIGDFLYTKSVLSQGKRADPKHPAYGLFDWSDGSGGIYYPDDNARGLLGMIAAAGVLETDRWDERTLRGVLANLRISGRLGFGPGSIGDAALEKNGWQHYFRSRPVSAHPHYQSYIWACYLWAYRHTGFEPFRDRAKTAIRITMETYPDRWIWTLNQMQIERARILLPLAWLVRVEDTPEHRAWLRRMADELLAFQDASGAIQERIPSQFQDGSNEQYGTRETALIQTNGDPAADMLYTCNFALLGLHEAAAATGDPFYRQAADKLARFLSRIQVRSEGRPELDGVWLRGFDFRRWDYWASNGDVGWGAWCAETGWMQAWIVGVLAMRELNTSLWEIAAKSKIEKCFEESRRAMIPDEAIQAEKVDRFAHAAVGKPVKLAIQADPRYPGWGPPGLTDGCFGGTDLGGCLGFEGPDLDATLDLGKPESIHALAAEFRQSVPVGVFLPTQVEFAVSDDGQAFHPVATVKPTVSLHEQGPLAQVFAAGNLDVKARYVRVHADSVGVIPDWHPAKGRKAWLFVDEIMVNPVKGE